MRKEREVKVAEVRRGEGMRYMYGNEREVKGEVREGILWVVSGSED